MRSNASPRVRADGVVNVATARARRRRNVDAKPTRGRPARAFVAARADAAPRARVAAPQSSPDARARDVRANAIAEPPRASTFERDERDERIDVTTSKSSFGAGDGEVPTTDAQRRAAMRSQSPLRYAPEASAAKFTKDPVRVAARAADIATSLSSFAVSVALDYQRGTVEENARKRAAELREKLTRLGPAFVKVGQALSTRPDLLPTQYLEELSTLQDALPTFADADAFALVEKELGRPLETMFQRDIAVANRSGKSRTGL